MAEVMVAMSGGVDSTMAAALLLEAGHNVTGVHLKMADTPSGLPGKGCCTLDDARDARRVCDRMGIPFYVWDFHEDFTERVVDDFLYEYAAGRTPNPCVRCNERVKYAALQDRALDAGFDYLATGHHVILQTDADGNVGLFRPTDSQKDQTYVLYMANQFRLRHSLFPCGEYKKADLRIMAKERNLITANKPDSTDICFIPMGKTSEFLHKNLGEKPGIVVDGSGKQVGTHDGAFAFTIGQRKGLGVSGMKEPHFVTNVSQNIVTIGTKRELEVSGLTVANISWTKHAPTVEQLSQLQAQVRYHGVPLDIALELVDEPAAGDCAGALAAGAMAVGDRSGDRSDNLVSDRAEEAAVSDPCEPEADTAPASADVLGTDVLGTDVSANVKADNEALGNAEPVPGSQAADAENMVEAAEEYNERIKAKLGQQFDLATGVGAKVTFTKRKPFGVAPGQAIVFYIGDECLGGGTIMSTISPQRSLASNVSKVGLS